MSEMRLVWPAREHLPSYIVALERGWPPDSVRGEAASREELTPVDVGRGILRQHRFAVAARDRCASAVLPGPHRLRGGSMETAARLRHTSTSRGVTRCGGGGSPL